VPGPVVISISAAFKPAKVAVPLTSPHRSLEVDIPVFNIDGVW
jgi:hypothetical protein